MLLTKSSKPVVLISIESTRNMVTKPTYFKVSTKDSKRRKSNWLIFQNLIRFRDYKEHTSWLDHLTSITGTIKNIIAAFGILFRDVEYVNDWGQTIKVPIHYSPREKFIEITEVSGDHDDGYETMVTLPRFGFELTSVDYDSTRMLNPMSRMTHRMDSESRYMFNRVPYNFAFNLYLATRKFEDSLKIVEQVVPFFAPDLNITIKDKEDFDISTDIPIVLNNTGFVIDYQGSFDLRRTVQWDFSFTAKGYLYSNVREQTRIKETIVKMTNQDFDKVYESLISEVEPRDAEKTDVHIIKDSVIDGPPPSKLTIDFGAGELLQMGADDSTPYTVLEVREMVTGSVMRVVPMQGSL